MKKVNFIYLLFMVCAALTAQSNSMSYEEQVSLNQKLLEEIENGDTTAVKALLSKGANMNASTYEGVSALMFSVIYGDYDIARMLVIRGADLNKSPYDGKSPLMEAAEQELIEIGELLILNKANMQQEDYKGNTAMHYAIKNGSYYFTEMLLFYEDSVENKTKDGSSPLMLSAFYGDSNICELLIKYGADIETNDENGFTPLMCAAQQGNKEVLQVLLDYGADTEVKNNYGLTAICYAVKNGHQEIVELLIEYGANYNYTIHNGYNLLYLAEKNGQYEIKRYLKEQGAVKRSGFSFDKIYLNNGINFSSRDAFYRMGGGLAESGRNIGFGLIYYKRFGYSPIIENDNDIFLQLRENRSLIGFNFSKDFKIYEVTNITNVGVKLELEEAFSYGRYRALERNPKGKFVFSPALGVYYRKGGIYTIFKYQYMDLGITEFPISRFEFGIGLDFVHNRNLVKEKTIK